MNLDIFEVNFKDPHLNDVISFKLFQNNNIIMKGLKKNIIKHENDMEFVRIIVIYLIIKNTLGFSKKLNFHFLMIKSLINLKKFNVS